MQFRLCIANHFIGKISNQSTGKAPITLLRRLKEIDSKYYLLESVEGGRQWGQYSFLGVNPLLQISCKNGVVTMKSGAMVASVTAFAFLSTCNLDSALLHLGHGFRHYSFCPCMGTEAFFTLALRPARENNGIAMENLV